MKTNMGNVDRSVRILAALIIAWLYFSNTLSGTAGLVLLLLAVVFVVTSFVGVCPLYLPFRFSTKSKKKSGAA